MGQPFTGKGCSSTLIGSAQMYFNVCRMEPRCPSGDYILAVERKPKVVDALKCSLKNSISYCSPPPPIPAPSIFGFGCPRSSGKFDTFTSPFNLTGLPALTLPCGFTKTGLPIGLQIVSKHWGEAKVLQAGHAFEQATEWHDRHPDI